MNPNEKIIALARPLILTFTATGAAYPLSSEEAQRLIDAYPALEATPNGVVLRADDGHACTITPATLGGGPAFEIA